MQKTFPKTFEEYMQAVEWFHGTIAPGVLIGWFMVDLARRHVPEGKLYDVISETTNCLPDAVQLLTPCSIGNQWLKIFDVGRYALAFYEKQTGKGVRVYLDNSRLEAWPEIRTWYLRLKPKQDQDSEKLLHEIIEAGTALLEIENIRVSIESLKRIKGEPISICPLCHEAYPSSRGSICPACKSKVLPYVSMEVISC
jgi:formylmethanofuran dehydrogenase subunit E